MASNQPNSKPTKIPKGLEELLEKCNSLYPSQKNPLQVIFVIYFYLGGWGVNWLYVYLLLTIVDKSVSIYESGLFTSAIKANDRRLWLIYNN